ncbi:hypothetical protein RSF51_002766 [Yersinia enterocolitica]|uniref:Uncharacterized protein n=1 Tax=Yersinia enterocolitica TaxID=630 RepID=A0A0H5GN17_YEREN|nr:hypothetical protein [Yersinia enterocolitica]EKN3331755.1 hypothetical protein [Yersinia enterocolitica]EKN3497014.1 hypothetical protein [Yersinia enterocolitica]EKN3510293.1 hypothetical protein [Yersinia enterocolitica]EKN3557953.1 hypothetical protein [Yersinia enterocolitica]EKN3693835.1 hypothetical protein [Yersinia enterocolitica]
MANYIDSNILSQSYVHVEPTWLTSFSDKQKEDELQRIKDSITEYAQKRLKFFLYEDIDIEVEFEDGSIKAKITAYGKVCVLLSAINPVGHAISNYPEYREGIKAIISDVSKIGNVVNSEVLFQTKSRSKDEIIRVEARKGIVGSLEKIHNKMTTIENKLVRKDNSPLIIYNDLLDLNKYISELDANLKDKNDRDSISKSLYEGVNGLNLKKGKFKLTDSLSEDMYNNLLAERKIILQNLSKW